MIIHRDADNGPRAGEVGRRIGSFVEPVLQIPHVAGLSGFEPLPEIIDMTGRRGRGDAY